VKARTPRPVLDDPVRSDSRGSERSAEAIISTVLRVIVRLGGTTGVDGIGIASAGLVNGSTGTVVRATNLVGFDQPVPLLELVRRRLEDAPDGLRLALGNDVNALARAEAARGALEGESDALVVALGTGVGGALLLDGRIRMGPRGFAGELGHVVVHPGGRPCGCGGHGHLEAYVGRAALELEARRRHRDGRSTLLVELAGDRRISSSVWDRALGAGDAVALDLRLEAATAVAVAVGQASTLLDLPLVVIGGGFAPVLGQPFRTEVERQLSDIGGAGAPLLRSAALGDRAGAIGAALLVAR
jgi:glucokinase